MGGKAKGLRGKGIGDDIPRVAVVGSGSWGKNLVRNLHDSGYLNYMRSHRPAIRLCDIRAGRSSRRAELLSGILRCRQAGRVGVSLQRAVVLSKDQQARGIVGLRTPGLRHLSLSAGTDRWQACGAAYQNCRTRVRRKTQKHRLPAPREQ
jgi:hypothetical protein